MKKEETTVYNYSFMAVARGRETKEFTQKLFIGIAPVFVLGVNPTKAELETFFEREFSDDPVYIGTNKVNTPDGEQEFEQIRIEFLVQTDADKAGVEWRTRIPFFLTNTVRYNKDFTSVQVINKYGETAFLPIEHVQAGTVPENMAWFDTDGMRPTFIGEDDLTGFIKKYLGIPNKSYKDSKTGEVVTIDNLEDAEVQLDEIASYFKGDISELQGIIGYQPKNKVKSMFGVRTTSEGKTYQAVYTREFIHGSVTNYSGFDSRFQEKIAAGAYPTTEFSVEPLREYTVESTNYGSTLADAPKEEAATAPWNAWNNAGKK